MDKFRKHQQEKSIISKDKKYIKDLIATKAKRPEDFCFNVDVKSIKSKQAQVEGSRTVIIKNKKTKTKKNYTVTSFIANDWYSELTSDVEEGFFEKRDTKCR